MGKPLTREETGATYSAICPECMDLLHIDEHFVHCPNRCYVVTFNQHVAHTGEWTRARESKEHDGLKQIAAAWLEKQGYVPEIEAQYRLSRPVQIRKGRLERHVQVDVVGRKRGRDIVAIECGTQKPRTFDVLHRSFKLVYRWRFGWKEPRSVPMKEEFKGLRLTWTTDRPNGYYRS